MLWGVVLILVATLVSACASSGMEVIVTVPGGVPGVATDAVVRILDRRLADMVGDSARVEATEQGIEITLAHGTDPVIVDLVIAQGCVSMRPVLEVTTEMPDTTTAAADHFYVADSQGLVYHTGPAFIDGGFVDGRVASIDGPDGTVSWLVEPTLSERGNEAFVEVTKTLATHPLGDPQRQIAVVLDGQVLSAPQLAPEVDPVEGLDPDVIVFTIGEGAMMQERAQALATYLRHGCLPVQLEVADQ